jgi:hypothetical protein
MYGGNRPRGHDFGFAMLQAMSKPGMAQTARGASGLGQGYVSATFLGRESSEGRRGTTRRVVVRPGERKVTAEPGAAVRWWERPTAEPR